MAVHDHTEVHRVVLPYRAWEMLELVGKEQAHTLLRQSVRYCVKAESWTGGAADSDYSISYVAGTLTVTTASRWAASRVSNITSRRAACTLGEVNRR